MSAPSPSDADALRCPWLLADIGGTHARFALADGPGQAPRALRQLATADHAGPAEAAQAYLAGLPPGQAPARPPRRAAFAVAAPGTGADEWVFTNSPWRLSARAVQQALGLDELLLLNDFEALALALPGLRPGQWQALPPAPQPAGLRRPMAVVGPGTGLGVGGVLPRPDGGWLAAAGEGGHATLAPADALESELLACVRRQHAHVSAERLLSGVGLPLLHQALGEVRGVPAPTLATPALVQAGLAGQDPLASQTLTLFCALLGGFAGNVALTLGARGGVFIGGGIVPRLGAFFAASPFHERFLSKGRYRGYLAEVPLAVITDTQAALGGALQALAQSTPTPR